MRRLPRVLGPFDVTVLAAASMGPAYSIAATLGPMIAAAGTIAPLALALLAALMLAIALGFSRLARAHPDAGSSFGWIATAFGPRVGAYGAWLLLLSNFFATLSIALPAGTYTLELTAPALATSPLAVAIVGAAWILASGLLLSRGMRPTALASVVFLAAEFAVLAASALAAARHPAAVAPPGAVVPRVSFGGLATAMALGIFVCDGWEVSASASEETIGTETAGRGGLLGLAVTTIVVVLAMLAYVRLCGVPDLLGHQSDALASVAVHLGGGWWTPAIAGTVLVSTAATLWTTVLYLTRSIYAMGVAGVVPRELGRLDVRSEPRNATLAVVALTALATLATGLSPSAGAALALVLGGTSIFLGALFVGSVAAAARLFWRDPAERLAGVLLPSLGSAGLVAVIAATIADADAPTRLVELGGLALGVPFAAWRGGGRELRVAKEVNGRT